MPYVTESDYAELLRSDYQNSELRACIEALTAERDAAVAKLDIAERDAAIVYDAGITEGERRATAAIVAYARGATGSAWSRDVLQFADAIERGDHLTQP